MKGSFGTTTFLHHECLGTGGQRLGGGRPSVPRAEPSIRGRPRITLVRPYRTVGPTNIIISMYCRPNRLSRIPPLPSACTNPRQ